MAAETGVVAGSPKAVSAPPRVASLVSRGTVLLAILAAMLFVPLIKDVYPQRATSAVIFAIVGLSMNVLVGYTGQISLGQQAFVGAGALTAANVVSSGSAASDPFSFGLAIAAGAAVAGAAALVLGFIALRITGLYLALVTLVVGSVTANAIFTLNALNGHGAGLTASRPSAIESNYRFYLFALAIAALVIYVDVWITRTKVGRGLVAQRDDELVAQAFGINVLGYKLLGFTISGVMAGLAGGLFAFWNRSFSDKDFTGTIGFNKALIFVVMVVVGGLGSRTGVVIASAFFALLDPILDTLSTWTGWNNYYFDHKFYISSLIGASLLLQTIVMNPGGLGQVIRPLTRWLAGGRFSFHDPAGAATTTGSSHARA
jgi:branched-chain amino acid transport system permease protein